MTTLKRAAVAILLIAVWAPLFAQRTIDLDQVTIADVNAAFAKGTLTSERLTQIFLARIDAYDRKGPALRSVIKINPNALDTARAMDAERKTKGPRSPLHGVPIVLKDNIDTADMATTGGSVLLEGSMPPDDAFVVRKLRAAGAVIVAKVNLSEFASGAAHSSLGGQILNPHDLTRSPAGSSGGTGASIAAAFAMAGLGTDTGGSVRGPSTANGIAGLKTTMGLVSRDGVIPLALSFDTVGPMARSVHDVAAMLSVIAGVDPADASTKAGEGRSVADYTQSLKADALKGARLGIARDFLGQDTDVDWVMEASLEAMRKQGATIVDVRLPKWLLDAKGEYYNAIRYPEFVVQIADYLEDDRSEVSEEHHPADRSGAPRQRTAARRRQPESAALVADGARIGERHDHRLSIHVGARSRIAAGARDPRRHLQGQHHRRDRLSDLIAPAAAHRRAAGSARRRRHQRQQPREPVGFS